MRAEHVARCRRLGLWRRSPEAPENPALDEYWTRTATKGKEVEISRQGVDITLDTELTENTTMLMLTPQGPVGSLPAVPGVAKSAQANLWGSRFHSGQTDDTPSVLPNIRGQAKTKPATKAKAKVRAKSTLEVLAPMTPETVRAEAFKYMQSLASLVQNKQALAKEAERLGLHSPLITRLVELTKDCGEDLASIQGHVLNEGTSVEVYRTVMEKTAGRALSRNTWVVACGRGNSCKNL